MQYQLGALAACAAVVFYAVIRKYRKRSVIKDVPGPVNPSWIFGMSPGGRPGPFQPLPVDGTDCANLEGHQWYLQAEEVGGMEKRFFENFGSIVHWNGPFGVRLAFPNQKHAGVLSCACRRIVCGSQTPRRSTTSSTKAVICTRNRATSGKEFRWWPVVVLRGLRASIPS